MPRLFSDNAEAFVEFGEYLFRDECPCFYRLLDLRLLRVPTDLLIDLRLTFGPVSNVAEQHEENFSRGFGCHRISPSGEFGWLGSLDGITPARTSRQAVKSARASGTRSQNPLANSRKRA